MTIPSQKPKHRMYCSKSQMRCAVFHTDGICPDVRDCEACKEEKKEPIHFGMGTMGEEYPKQEKPNTPCGNCHTDHKGETLCREEDLEKPKQEECCKKCKTESIGLRQDTIWVCNNYECVCHQKPKQEEWECGECKEKVLPNGEHLCKQKEARQEGHNEGADEATMVCNEKTVPLAVKMERQSVLQEVEQLIINELLICQKEGTPTSRLTSLMMRIKELGKVV